jgi:hypothetical protein
MQQYLSELGKVLRTFAIVFGGVGLIWAVLAFLACRSRTCGSGSSIAENVSVPIASIFIAILSAAFAVAGIATAERAGTAGERAVWVMIGLFLGALAFSVLLGSYVTVLERLY